MFKGRMGNNHERQQMSNLINEDAAAQLMGIQRNTLTRWRWEGRGPRYCKIGRSVRYRPEDIQAFIARTVVENG